MITPSHHVSISVSDLDRSIAFYESVLGLRTTMRAPIDAQQCTDYLKLPPGTTGRMAMLQADGGEAGHVELVAIDPAPPATAPKRPGDPGIWMVAFQVKGETLADVEARLDDLGVTWWTRPMALVLEGYPTFGALLVEDPDGTVLEILELPTPEQVRAFRA